MLALIKREIQDCIVYFIATFVFSATMVVLLSAAAYYFDPREFSVYFGISIPITVMLVLGFSAMGVTQMYVDRNRRISAFLSTLPVTRSRILAAKIIAGLLAILIVLLPVTVAVIVSGRLLGAPVPAIFGVFIVDILTTFFLAVFACYCLGLLTGWTTNKIAPTFGALGLNLVLLSLIVIKGFGPEVKLLLVLVIVACLVRTWHKFTSTSL